MASLDRSALPQGEFYIALAYGLNPVPSLANQPGNGGERHLAAHGHQRLEQQRKAGELSSPAGLGQNHPAIGQWRWKPTRAGGR
jgi:hypothetical protein